MKTDNIIKSLRVCTGLGTKCFGCTFHAVGDHCDNCTDDLMRVAADRLENQEAKILDLESRIKYLFERSTVCREECNGRQLYVGTYRHFKGRDYLVIGTALHTETNETLVLYKECFDGQKIFARPLEMFLSEVDQVKYPDAIQKYRFERKESE